MVVIGQALAMAIVAPVLNGGGLELIASRGVAQTVGFSLDGPADPWEHSETGTMVRYVLRAPG